jgi:hypothetical protein
MAFFPSPGRPSTRRLRDERGVAFPSPLVMLSVLAVAMASITFVATRDQAPTERRVDTATIASADQSPSPDPKPAPTKEPKPKPQVKRGEVYVVVFNNSGIKGLAASFAEKATTVGWAVVGEDNWYGVVPTTTVYFPPRLKAAGKQLALDLGIKRTAPAVGEMNRDRLTIILTTDAPQ